MGAISVRGLSERLLADLKQEASREGISVNRLALRRLAGEDAAEGRGSGDLDALSGTWTEREAETFAAAIAPMEQLDPGLWE